MFSRRSPVADVLKHPIGSDIAHTLIRQLGLSKGWLKPFYPVPIGALKPLLGVDIIDTIINLLNAHPERALPDVEAPTWWKEAVFYQVYPRSFMDSNGNGIGDLPGVVSKLDYLADLGVDCLWLSPIFDSPNEDMGYDIRDYRQVMSEMGALADADQLIAECHKRGMRIILDLVFNHTSVEHPWAKAALASPDSPAADFYFLRESEHLPNNWVSFFSGPAWRYFPEADRWALHLFAPGQLDLNWDNPVVRREASDIVAWWMERGVDGFRLDVVNYISKAPGLPDGSEFVGDLLEFRGIEHYFLGPRLHEYLRELRAEGFTRKVAPRTTVRQRIAGGLGEPAPADAVGVMVGETVGVGVEIGKLLSRSNRQELDMVFNFDVLDNAGKTRWDTYKFDLNELKTHFIDYSKRSDAGDWIALFLDNHDNPRMLSKVAAGAEADPAIRSAVGKLLATMQLTLRGSPFLYQGQEIAAVNQRFPSIEHLRDVESINRYNRLIAEGDSPRVAWQQILTGTRDHARVPMRWTNEGGFSKIEPWLGLFDEQAGFSVTEQQEDPDSVLAWHKDLIKLRRSEQALQYGEIRFWKPKLRNYFAYIRGGEYFIELNLSDQPLKRPRQPGETRVVQGPEPASMMRPFEASVRKLTADIH